MATKDPKIIIKFTRNYEMKDNKAGTDDAEVYKKGTRKAFSAASANHFVSRGVAEYVKKPAKG